MIVYLRSALFLIWFAIISIVINIGFLPFIGLPRPVIMWGGRLWARLVLFGLKWIAGTSFELRGPMPAPQGLLIASKHLTMWETVAFQALYADPAIVLKRGLLKIPVYGWYCRKMKMIVVDREAGASAIRALVRQTQRALADKRPIIIFPEGTRRNVGAPPAYKPGIAALYAQLGVPCVPVAHNSGLYWQGLFIRRSGKIVVEYLEPILPGLDRREFMRLLETRIEEATNKLLAEGRAAQAAARSA